MDSLYWDDFKKREQETINCLKSNKPIPVRRVSIHITERCNFRCQYCNMQFSNNEMHIETFKQILDKYKDTALFHITGGEPSTVSWLYDFIKCNGNDYRFHLNTNAFIKPPAESVKRLKVSLDTYKENYFNMLVNKRDAFQDVIKNIKYACENTVTSITCVLSRQTYRDVPQFMKFCKEQFKGYMLCFLVFIKEVIQVLF